MRLVVTSAVARLTRADMPDDGRSVPKPSNGRQVAGLICDLLG